MGTFRVDDVTPVTDRLPAQPLGELFPEALLVGGDPAVPVLLPDGVSPLLSAVGRAFAEHRPLVLSPDAVWLTIAQGFAQHVRLHAEELRPHLVGHSGRKRLTVTVEGPMPRDPDSWRDAVESFDKLLAAELGRGDLWECDFSTSTDVERVAGRIVMLDAYSPYFALWMECVCGVPSITLTGTVEDWRKIRSRVDAIAGFGLEKWCRSLVSITDQFVRAAAGEVDTAFWRRIYNPIDAYGGRTITGWAARLYPYLVDGATDVANPLLELPIDEPRDIATVRGFYPGPGIKSDAVPATLSRVIVNVNDQDGGDNRVVALQAGLVGVTQDGDGALQPIAGWHLAPAAIEIDDVVDRIVRDHEATDPVDVDFLEACADIVALYDRIGSATLFGGAWRLLPRSEHWLVDFGTRSRTIAVMIELVDGRKIGAVNEFDFDSRATYWVVCRAEAVAEPSDGRWCEFRLVGEPADVPVLGTSLAMLLDAALDSGGDIAHLETGTLGQLGLSD